MVFGHAGIFRALLCRDFGNCEVAMYRWPPDSPAWSRDGSALASSKLYRVVEGSSAGGRCAGCAERGSGRRNIDMSMHPFFIALSSFARQLAA